MRTGRRVTPAHARTGAPTSPGRPRRAAALAAVALALAAGAGLHAWGARAWVIESPSMGGAAPVGSLVVTAPVGLSALEPGDVVAFRPPVQGAAVHVHRVVHVGADQWRTRGDLNTAQDPWPLTASTLAGRVAVVLPAAGTAVRALPLLLLAVLSAEVGARRLPPRYRGPLRLAAWSAALASTTVVLSPWTGAVSVPTDAGRGVEVVSTGLLPQHVSITTEQDGAPTVLGEVDLRYGEVAHLDVPERCAGAPLRLHVRPSAAAPLL